MVLYYRYWPFHYQAVDLGLTGDRYMIYISRNRRSIFVFLTILVSHYLPPLLAASTLEAAPPSAGESFPAVTKDGAWCWFSDPRAMVIGCGGAPLAGPATTFPLGSRQ